MCTHRTIKYTGCGCERREIENFCRDHKSALAPAPAQCDGITFETVVQNGGFCAVRQLAKFLAEKQEENVEYSEAKRRKLTK